LKEFRIKTTTGEIRWMHATSTPHLLPDGEILWNGVILDISDRVRADKALQRARDELETQVEKRTRELARANEQLKYEVKVHKQAKEILKETEQKYQHLTESLLDTVYEFDREGRFTYVNEAGTHMFGYSKEEILNSLRVQDTMVEKDRDLSQRVISEIFKGNITVGERTFLRKDGTQFIGEIHSGPIYKGNDVVGVRGVLRDITTSKQAEVALREKTHDLGERIKELNCLYNISHLVEKPDISLEETLQETVDLIPLSWQYPEITCARLILQDQTFTTDNFNETVWKQASDIMVHGERIGTLEVVCLEERPGSDEGPFLKEERSLINAIVRRLGKVIERKQAEEALKQERDNLQAALAEVKTLGGLLPICAHCKKIRDDKGYWNQIEAYIRDHSEADFSHSICPECAKNLYPEFYKGD